MRRYENGFDLKTDERYNLWVAQVVEDRENSLDSVGKFFCLYQFIWKAVVVF